MIKYDECLKLFYSTKINDGHFYSGFGTSKLGDGRESDLILNFFEKEKVDYNKIVLMEQVHSNRIVFVKGNNNSQVKTVGRTDGLISKEKGYILLARTADCLPVVFVSKEEKMVGISHQGWRGILSQLSEKMVEEMVKQGARKEGIVVALGPAIGACCYDIDEKRKSFFAQEFKQFADQIFEPRDKTYLNLTKLTFLILKKQGIKPANIDYFPFCTKCQSQMFYSYRRDRDKKYGENFSFILIK